jgi:Flp pilus assembly secretin CpaC
MEPMDRFRRTLLTLVLGAALLGAAAASANAAVPLPLTLESGHSVVLEAPQLVRLAVGDARIASVVAVGDLQVVVSAKSPGRTSVIVWTRTTRTSYEITVTEQTLDRIAGMIRASLSEPDVSLVNFDHSIVVRGSVEDVAHFATLKEILTRFEKLETAQKYSVVNAVTVRHPLGDLTANLTRVMGPNDIHLDPDAKGNVVVSGHVPDRVRAQWVLEQARGLAGAYLAGDGKVIDRLSVATVSQVDVKVRIYEVDKTALDQIGLRLQSGTPDASGNIVLGGPAFPILEQAQGLGRALNVGAFFRTTRLAPTLDLLVTNGNAKLLSEPELVTMPGTEATFLVGGEIPVPISTGLGAVSIIFKEFGVRLKFTPTILGNGSVETKIDPEVSDLDFQDGVSLNGFVIPALKTSRLSTDVVTASGESIVLGGMLRRIEQRNITKIPLLSSLPIIGALFKSTRYQHSETDIIFVMTPRIVIR